MQTYTRQAQIRPIASPTGLRKRKRCWLKRRGLMDAISTDQKNTRAAGHVGTRPAPGFQIPLVHARQGAQGRAPTNLQCESADPPSPCAVPCDENTRSLGRAGALFGEVI